MASYDPKAILGAQLETLATDIAKDMHVCAKGSVLLWSDVGLYDSTKPYALLAELSVSATGSWGFGQMFKIEAMGACAIFRLMMYGNGTTLNNNRVDIMSMPSTVSVGALSKLLVVTYEFVSSTCVVRIYSDCSFSDSQYQRTTLRQLDNQSGDLYSYEEWKQFTFHDYAGPGNMVATVSGTRITSYYVSNATHVNVSAYTTYSSILAEFNARRIPYYRYTSGNTTIDLTFAGTRAIPNVGMTLEFNAVQNNTIYYVGFAGSSSSFGTVRTFPLFSSDNVKTSSDTSSWSSDNTNVPTRAAVESKISSAMSGSLGGFLGSMSPNDISLYQISGHTFLKGDWFVVSESGTAYYYPNNDRSASSITLNLLEGDEYYWTTSGTLVKKPSTALHIYSITSLSDWNSLTSPGLYQITSQSGSVANSPISGRVSCLVSESDGAIGQIAFGNSSGSNNIYYRKKQWNGSWGTWRNVNDVDHATNADIAANYITDQSTTVSIHSKFTSVDNQIYDISNYKKIRVVNTLPSSPDSDTIYFI